MPSSTRLYVIPSLVIPVSCLYSTQLCIIIAANATVHSCERGSQLWRELAPKYPCPTRSYSSGLIRSRESFPSPLPPHPGAAAKYPNRQFIDFRVANTHILHRLPRLTSRPAEPRATSRRPPRTQRLRPSRPPTSSTAPFRRAPPRPRVASRAGSVAASKSTGNRFMPSNATVRE